MNKIIKNFDEWNVQKKTIHDFGKNKLYHARDIWWCDLGINIGFEQDGTGEKNGRPVLIIRGFSKEVCLIVPLSTSQKNNKYGSSRKKYTKYFKLSYFSPNRIEKF